MSAASATVTLGPEPARVVSYPKLMGYICAKHGDYWASRTGCAACDRQERPFVSRFRTRRGAR